MAQYRTIIEEVEASDFDAETLAEVLRACGWKCISPDTEPGVKDAGWMWRNGDYVGALIQLARDTGEEAFLDIPKQLGG